VGLVTFINASLITRIRMQHLIRVIGGARMREILLSKEQMLTILRRTPARIATLTDGLAPDQQDATNDFGDGPQMKCLPICVRVVTFGVAIL
jgi:hypothetical protein